MQTRPCAKSVRRHLSAVSVRPGKQANLVEEGDAVREENVNELPRSSPMKT